MQQIHGFAVAVPADDDVADVVHHAAKFKPSRLAREVFVLKELAVGHQVPGISYHKHVSDVGVTAKRIRLLNCIQQLVGNIDSFEQTHVNLVGIIRESIQVKKTAFGSGLSRTFWNSLTISALVVCRYRMIPRSILSILVVLYSKILQNLEKQGFSLSNVLTDEYNT